MKILSRLDNLKSFQNVYNCITPHPYPHGHLPRPLQALQASQALQELCQRQNLAKIVPDSAYIPKTS